MLRLVKQQLLWLMLLLASVGWLITGCDKDDRISDSTGDSVHLNGQSPDDIIEQLYGRLIFKDQNHFSKTLKKIAHEDDANIPNGFRSYYNTFRDIEHSLDTEEKFKKFVESRDFHKYFRIEKDEEGLKSMVPILDSYLFGSVLNTNLEVQIGHIVYKYDENYEYKVPANLYSSSNFRQMAQEINPIVRKVAISDNSRGYLLDDCTEFFGKKHGSWQNKMQGKIWFTGTGPWWEWKVETRSRKRSSFGWWVSNNKYDLEQTGSLVATVNFNNGNSPQTFTLDVDKDCTTCSEIARYINNSSFPVSITTIYFIELTSINSTHRLECGNDCSGESATGWMQCSNSEP